MTRPIIPDTALDPDILFFDEPSAGLDPVTAAGLDHLLIDLKRVFGMTVVVTMIHSEVVALTITLTLAQVIQPPRTIQLPVARGRSGTTTVTRCSPAVINT